MGALYPPTHQLFTTLALFTSNFISSSYVHDARISGLFFYQYHFRWLINNVRCSGCFFFKFYFALCAHHTFSQFEFPSIILDCNMNNLNLSAV